jgi:hypothetical protein
MTHETPPPLDHDVRALLATERAIDDEVSDETKHRLRRRLQASLGAAVVGTGVAVGAHAAAKGTALGSIAGGGWIVAVGAFVLGALVGAGAHAYAHRHDAPSPPVVTTVVVERQVEVPVYVTSSATAPASVQAPAPPPPPLAASVTSKQPSAQPSVSAGTSDTSLAAERSLLEIARTALARGDSASALDALGKHQAQFPQGQLSEEREALYVQALAMAGRTAEAKQRADRFRKTWPGSMLLPVVEAAVE